MSRLFAAALVTLITLPASPAFESYTIGPDYAIRFDTRGAEGTFGGLTGAVVFDADDLPASRFDVTVDARTIATGNATKDKHARGDAWFDVERYPDIGFESAAFAKTADGYAVTGTLDLHGVRREVTIPFTFEDDVFEGALTVDRGDYGVDGPFPFGGTVGREVAIVLRVPVE